MLLGKSDPRDDSIGGPFWIDECPRMNESVCRTDHLSSIGLCIVDEDVDLLCDGSLDHSRGLQEEQLKWQIHSFPIHSFECKCTWKSLLAMMRAFSCSLS